jgi:hypothetical protein
MKADVTLSLVDVSAKEILAGSTSAFEKKLVCLRTWGRTTMIWSWRGRCAEYTPTLLHCVRKAPVSLSTCLQVGAPKTGKVCSLTSNHCGRGVNMPWVEGASAGVSAGGPSEPQAGLLSMLVANSDGSGSSMHDAHVQATKLTAIVRKLRTCSAAMQRSWHVNKAIDHCSPWAFA